MDIELTDSGWKSLRLTDESDIVDARLQLHYAAQIPASFASTVFDAVDDYSHTAFEWDEKNQALIVNRRFEAQLRPGLRLSDCSLVIINEAGEVSESFNLRDRSLEQGNGWLLKLVRQAGYAVESLTPPGHEMPGHQVAEGAAFDAADESLLALASWYSNADSILQQVRRDLNNSSPVYCWPHHFDIATLIKIDDDGNDDDRSVGFGLSPGDNFSPRPYWYVQPWPPPSEDDLPAFEPLGEWYTNGWTGALLRGERLTSMDAADQQQAVTEFLEFGWKSAQHVLDID